MVRLIYTFIMKQWLACRAAPPLADAMYSVRLNAISGFSGQLEAIRPRVKFFAWCDGIDAKNVGNIWKIARSHFQKLRGFCFRNRFDRKCNPTRF